MFYALFVFSLEAQLVQAPAGIAFDKAVFTKTEVPVLYAGASNFILPASPAMLQYSIARAFLTNTNTLAVQGIAYPQVYIGFNEAPQANPLYGQLIKHMTLLGTEPLVSLNRATDPDGGSKLYLITGPEYGRLLYTHNQPLKDAGNNDVDEEIAGLTASQEMIFAAVSAHGQLFDDAVPAADNRAVVVLEKNMLAGSLIQKNPGTKIDLTLSGGLAFSQSALLDGSSVSMVWSEELKRLFVGLTLKRTNAAANGGVVTVLVGRLDANGIMRFESLLPGATGGLFPAGSLTQSVIGYAATNTDPDVTLGVSGMQVMKTSTGYYYLIMSVFYSDPVAPREIEGIYAVPLNGPLYADGTAVPENRIGTLAKQNFSTGALASGNIPLADAPAVRVGGFFDDPAYPCITRCPNDFFVQGDTVYCSMGNSESRHVGVRATTAIFNDKGQVSGWTPARPVGLPLTRVACAALDWSTDRWYALCEDQGQKYDPQNPVALSVTYNTFLASSWTKQLLTELFPQAEGGVYCVKSFDALYPTFYSSPAVSIDGDSSGMEQTKIAALTVLVATGKGKVALIQTGERDVFSDQFYPVTNYTLSGPDQNIFFFNDEVLASCGALTSAAMSQTKQLAYGWLFVAGQRGVAVLRNPATGLGYPALAGLQGLSKNVGAYPGAVGEHTFKLLTPSTDPDAFKNMRALIASVSGLTLMTEQKIFGLTFDGTTPNKFADAPATALGETLLTQAPENLFFNDLVIAQEPALFLHVLATTQGLFVTKGAQDIRAINFSQFTQISVDGQLGKDCMQLYYLSDKMGYDGTQGQLYVLVRDRAQVGAEVALYRYALNKNAAQARDLLKPVGPNNGLVKRFLTPAGAVLCTGNRLVQVNGKNFEDGVFVRVTPGHEPRFDCTLDDQLGLSYDTNYYAALPEQEKASGADLFAGDWGIVSRQ